MVELARKTKAIWERFRGAKPVPGSLAYRKNRDAIWRGEIPEKYRRIIELVPGESVLELGSAEGVLSLLLAQRKQKVIALEMKTSRHEEALRLKAHWSKQGIDVGRCEMVPGRINDRLDLLQQVDTLLAVRSIYYLRDDIKDIFRTVGEHVENVVLCGNKNRARKYQIANGNPDDALGKFNYYASLEGMEELLEGCGYEVVRTVPDGDPIVVGIRRRR